MSINKELAIQIAIKQNNIRNKITLLKLEKSEIIKDFNDQIKEQMRALQEADQEWIAGAVQMEFGFNGGNNES